MNVFRSKNFWLGIVLFFVVFFWLFYSALDSAVYINDNGRLSVVFAKDEHPLDILSKAGIGYKPTDLVRYSIVKNEVDTISITRSYPVYISADGQTKVVYSLGESTQELLKSAELTLRENDKLNMELAYVPKEKEKIEITRVDYREYESQEVIPKLVTTKHSSLIKLGTTRVIESGKDGAVLYKYRDKLENGVVVSTELLSSQTLRDATEELQLMGTKDQISNFDYSDDYPLDANGIPKNYVHVFKNQRATGYWRGGNAWGSNGMLCEAGTVAVRSSQIPYGSKLYIRTPSGDFIYGYCVANDTGTALMDNIIDVDLFYETYEESKWNSVRWVDIYVLSWGDGKYYKAKTDADVLK